MCWLMTQGKIASHADHGMAERRPLRTTFGRVSERDLFHVEIQTEDRDLTTLPKRMKSSTDETES